MYDSCRTPWFLLPWLTRSDCGKKRGTDWSSLKVVSCWQSAGRSNTYVKAPGQFFLLAQQLLTVKDIMFCCWEKWKASSHQESNPGFLVQSASAVPLDSHKSMQPSTCGVYKQDMSLFQLWLSWNGKRTSEVYVAYTACELSCIVNTTSSGWTRYTQSCQPTKSLSSQGTNYGWSTSHTHARMHGLSFFTLKSLSRATVTATCCLDKSKH